MLVGENMVVAGTVRLCMLYKELLVDNGNNGFATQKCHGNNGNNYHMNS